MTKGLIKKGKKAAHNAISISLIVTTVIVVFVKSIVGLRVSEQEENTEGCDFGSHGESSYHL